MYHQKYSWYHKVTNFCMRFTCTLYLHELCKSSTGRINFFIVPYITMPKALECINKNYQEAHFDKFV